MGRIGTPMFRDEPGTCNTKKNLWRGKTITRKTVTTTGTKKMDMQMITKNK
jgi:hypothetical protein